MLDYNEILAVSPYSLLKQEKEELLTQKLSELTKYHYEHCIEYKGMLDCIGFNVVNIKSYYDIPFLPVRLFKELDLLSIGKNDIFKTMTSSGTTGQAVSKIFLDKTTASNQQKTLVKIVSSFAGSGRMPMLIIDCPSVVKDKYMLSARGAGIIGFSIFGSEKNYALDENLNLNLAAITEFLGKHKGKKILIFGYTFIVWQHFYKELVRWEKETGEAIDLSNGLFIHGGGWKKLASEAVSPQEFHDRLKAVCGLDDIHDYYGMVEQTGCIFMQCEYGHLHASVFSDVIIRNPLDFSVSGVGETGMIQVISMIPESYPGHSLLTEDEGILLGEDDCPCERKGKYFKILGRLQNTELRGCSDTYDARF
jgi:phenylacetate-coenzyme A ligase PaaK-like adenylate-forming protein